jgi:hypothetical protein
VASNLFPVLHGKGNLHNNIAKIKAEKSGEEWRKCLSVWQDLDVIPRFTKRTTLRANANHDESAMKGM